MARKATDLLDVFRFSNEDGDDTERTPKARPKRPKRAGKKKAAARGDGRRSRFEGISLNRRQVLIASSAVGLLLLLSFFLGLAAGGSDSGDGSASLERREARRYVIRARVPLVDPARRKQADPAALKQALSRDYRIHSRNLRVRRMGADVVIDIGPFASRDKARQWLERSGLELWRVHMQDPFRFAEYVPID